MLNIFGTRVHEINKYVNMFKQNDIQNVQLKFELKVQVQE